MPAMTLRLLRCFAPFALFVATSASGQSVTSSKDPGQWALIYHEVMENNRLEQSAWTWQYRIEVREEGELLYVDLLEATRSDRGALVAHAVEKEMKIKERHGLLSRAGQEKRLARIQQKIDFIRETILSYVYMSRGEIVDFFDRAEVTDAEGYDNALRVEAANVLKDSDSITLYGDRGTAHPILLEFSVPFEESIHVNGRVEFRHIRNSDTFYGAEIQANFTETKAPGKTNVISVEVESFDFQRK